MSTTTAKLGLVKPEMTDAADITAMNGNWDKIDTKLDEKANTSDLPNITKNTDDTTGDVISTHLTVGTRADASFGDKSFTMGTNNSATVVNAFSTGYGNSSNGGQTANLGGMSNTATGLNSVTIGGYFNTASGTHAIALGGIQNNVLAYQAKTGHFAKDGTAGAESGTTGDAFTIGNGTSSARANCFRVDYAGNVYGLSSFKGTGADYAEYFEWLDGNTDSIDRRGMFVTLDGEKIRIANDTDDYILGVVSALPSICGDTQSEVWQGMYLKDVYGAYLTDDGGNMILNPEYDDKNEYISREHRKEWSAVGMLGKLVVRDDGTCQVNEYCEVSKNGIATSSETGYRVLSRVDDTHVKILFR